jgi:glucose 1-dehydrogenase
MELKTMKRCQGKTALVTGACTGMGRGIALCLAAEGANIAVNDVCPAKDARYVQDELETKGVKTAYWQADVSDREAMGQMITGIASHFGSLDICVANAGISIPEPVIEADWEHVKRTIEVTHFGVFHTCQFAAQQMVKQVKNGHLGGKIIIICSVHEELAVRGSGAYNMAKAAIAQLGRTMAVELGPYHINVNVINPGLTDTPGTRSVNSEENLERAAFRIPLMRLGTPEDIGKAAAFLASDDADYITGETLRVDGGFKLGVRYPLDD